MAQQSKNECQTHASMTVRPEARDSRSANPGTHASQASARLGARPPRRVCAQEHVRLPSMRIPQECTLHPGVRIPGACPPRSMRLVARVPPRHAHMDARCTCLGACRLFAQEHDMCIQERGMRILARSALPGGHTESIPPAIQALLKILEKLL